MPKFTVAEFKDYLKKVMYEATPETIEPQAIEGVPEVKYSDKVIEVNKAILDGSWGDGRLVLGLLVGRSLILRYSDLP